MLKVNLACGGVFVDSPDWLNLDFAPTSPTVRKANLLGRLPVADGAAALVYSSHFLEHVPRDLVPGFLRECWRVLRPGGVVRLVLPDLENLAREYLAMREAGEHEKADFVVLEMIDHCVRRESGGEFGKVYRRLSGRQGDDVEAMIDYIRARTGEDLRALPAAGGGDTPQAACGTRCVDASNAPGFACACWRCPRLSGRKTSVWPRWASGTIGCGISISSRRRSKKRASRTCSVAAPTPAWWSISHSIRSTSMPTACRARERSRCTWRRANPLDAAGHRSPARRAW